jgi:hypothetical protein
VIQNRLGNSSQQIVHSEEEAFALVIFWILKVGIRDKAPLCLVTRVDFSPRTWSKTVEELTLEG